MRLVKAFAGGQYLRGLTQTSAVLLYVKAFAYERCITVVFTPAAIPDRVTQRPAGRFSEERSSRQWPPQQSATLPVNTTARLRKNFSMKTARVPNLTHRPAGINDGE